MLRREILRQLDLARYGLKRGALRAAVEAGLGGERFGEEELDEALRVLEARKLVVSERDPVNDDRIWRLA
jgi:hypothetical protein